MKNKIKESKNAASPCTNKHEYFDFKKFKKGGILEAHIQWYKINKERIN